MKKLRSSRSNSRKLSVTIFDDRERERERERERDRRATMISGEIIKAATTIEIKEHTKQNSTAC